MSEKILTDIDGKVIAVGARVAYFRGGRYNSINVAEVVEIRKRVKIRIIESSRGHFDGLREGEATWTDGDRLVVLEEAPHE